MKLKRLSLALYVKDNKAGNTSYTNQVHQGALREREHVRLEAEPQRPDIRHGARVRHVVRGGRSSLVSSATAVGLAFGVRALQPWGFRLACRQIARRYSAVSRRRTACGSRTSRSYGGA